MRKTATKKAGKRAALPTKKRSTKRKSAATDAESQTAKKEECTGPEADAIPVGEATQLQLIRKLIERLSNQLTSTSNSKGTLNDLLKLLQLEKEMAPQEHRELVVSWVTPWDEQ